MRVVLTSSLLLALTACGASPAPTPALRFSTVYMDLDGTALGPDNVPLPATVEALAAFKACGGRVGLASGRTPEQVLPVIDALAPTLPLVLFNGAVLTDASGKTVLSALKLPAGVVPLVDEALPKDDPTVFGVFLKSLGETKAARSTPGLIAYAERAHTQITGTCEPLSTCAADQPEKLVVVVEEGKGEPVAARLKAALAGKARAMQTSPRTVEVVANEANKADGIKAALARVGGTVEDTLVFGDSENDLEMLSQFPASVVMGNGHPEALKVAVVRAHDHGTDAIARVIKGFVLTSACPVKP